MIRITADWDFKSKIKLCFALSKTIFLISNIKLLQLMPSTSKGYHLIVWSNKNYTQKQQYLLRKKILDDKRRIEIDKKRKVGRNTLFNYKKYS